MILQQVRSHREVLKSFVDIVSYPTSSGERNGSIGRRFPGAPQLHLSGCTGVPDGNHHQRLRRSHSCFGFADWKHGNNIVCQERGRPSCCPYFQCYCSIWETKRANASCMCSTNNTIHERHWINQSISIVSWAQRPLNGNYEGHCFHHQGETS
ncbi:uncharacterized protein [Henckelia pumila]|uniref:uncharacterized protein isoform X1 n=1 Tax=Henckelia pumila TaxID=405737 RepID=UPI003C6E17A9